MNDSIRETIRRIISLPIHFNTENKSLVALLRESGYLESYQNISVEQIASVLKENPVIIDEWLKFSADKRSDEGWYFTRSENDSYYVSRFPKGENLKRLVPQTNLLLVPPTF